MGYSESFDLWVITLSNIELSLKNYWFYVIIEGPFLGFLFLNRLNLVLGNWVPY